MRNPPHAGKSQAGNTKELRRPRVRKRGFRPVAGRPHRDGVEFSNGVRIALHRLGLGVMVSLANKIEAAPAAKTQEQSDASGRIIELEPAE